MLKPEYQMEKLGSIGFESLGTDFVKILDEEGNEVDVGGDRRAIFPGADAL